MLQKAEEQAGDHGQGLSPLEMRPLGQLPGHEKTLDGQDLSESAQASNANEVCGGRERTFWNLYRNSGR